MASGNHGQDLRRELGVADADALYAAIIEGHGGLSHEESVALNARLVLLLANHVGNLDVLREAIAAARKSLRKAAEGGVQPG